MLFGVTLLLCFIKILSGSYNYLHTCCVIVPTIRQSLVDWNTSGTPAVVAL